MGVAFDVKALASPVTTSKAFAVLEGRAMENWDR